MDKKSRMDKKRSLLTIDEAARLLNVSKTSLRRWTNDGRLRCHRVGVRRERRFSLEDLNAFLNEGAAQTPITSSYDPVAFLDSVADKGTPRHVCLHFHNADEQWRLYRPYLLAHLRAGSPVRYIYDVDKGMPREDILRRLREEGEDPEALIEKGLFNPIPSSEAYLKTGEFSPDRMIDYMESIILEMRASGFEQVLLSGEMTWCLSGAPGAEKMIPYEEQLNGFLEKYPGVTIVCHYDINLLDGATTLGALCSHPIVQLPDRMVHGFYAA
jgi:excisionase family DNA binding protein